MVSGLRGSTYEDKLVELNMMTLKEQRTLQDQVQLYKIMHKLDSVDISTWFNMVGEGMANTRLKNHLLNIIPRRVYMVDI